MQANVGRRDGMLRIVLGAVIVVLWLVGVLPAGGWGVVAGLVGLVLLATGVFRFCPAYLLFGKRTCGR